MCVLFWHTNAETAKIEILKEIVIIIPSKEINPHNAFNQRMACTRKKDDIIWKA